MSDRHVMILAGEASGDAHAAAFVEQLKQLEPGIRCTGMGSKAEIVSISDSRKPPGSRVAQDVRNPVKAPLSCAASNLVSIAK